MNLKKIRVKRENKPVVEDEYQVCKRISKYLTLQYPNVVFHFDFGSGARLTMGQAIRNKELNPRRGYPDLFVSEPRGVFHGLYIEVKKEGERLFKKDGTPRTPHIAEQEAFLDVLRAKNYGAYFGIGFEDCRIIIDSYLYTI